MGLNGIAIFLHAPLIAFLTISDQYTTFFLLTFFYKMAAGGHFGWPKITFDRIFRHFRCQRPFWTYLYSRAVATSNMKLIGVFLIKLWSAQAFSSYFRKMAVGGHFGFSIGFFHSRSSMAVSYIWYAHWCLCYVKHKPCCAASRPKP